MLNLLIGANVLMVVVFAIKFNTLPPQLPLFFNRPSGESQLIDAWMIFLIPLIMNSLYTLNNYMEKRYFASDELLKVVFRYFNPFLIVTFTLIFIKLIFLVS